MNKSNGTNSTVILLSRLKTLETRDILLASFLIGINVLIFCGNILVIICLFHKRSTTRLRTDSSSKQRRANLFILNLAITDLMLSILIIPPNILQVITGNWMLGNTFCKVNCYEYFSSNLCITNSTLYLSSFDNKTIVTIYIFRFG